MLQFHRAHDRMFGCPTATTTVAPAVQPLSLCEIDYVCRKRKRQIRMLYFYQPFAGLPRSSYQSQSQSSKLRIINPNFCVVWIHLGGLCSWQDPSHRQTTKLSSRCPANVTRHNQLWVMGLALSSWVLSSNSSAISLIFSPNFGELLSHNFFLTCHQSFLPGVDWERVAGNPSCQFCGASHVPPQSYSVNGAASPWWVFVNSARDWHPVQTAAHTMNRF